MRCGACDRMVVRVEMGGVDGRTLTMQSCCGTRWFSDGQPVPLAELVRFIPSRRAA